jgi:hypothetical protein
MTETGTWLLQHTNGCDLYEVSNAPMYLSGRLSEITKKITLKAIQDYSRNERVDAQVNGYQSTRTFYQGMGAGCEER